MRSIETRQNKESTTLIWFDPRMEIAQDTDGTEQRLRQINDYVLFHENGDQCLMEAESIRCEKILLVVCGSLGLEIVPRINSLSQLEAIFIFCEKKSWYESSLLKYDKVVGVFVDFSAMCAAIRSKVHAVDKQMDISGFFSGQEKSFKDLVEESVDFRWFQLFTQVILHLPRDERAKSHMSSSCRQYYHANFDELQLINKFEQHYEKDQA